MDSTAPAEEQPQPKVSSKMNRETYSRRFAVLLNTSLSLSDTAKE
jgi:hypothetical protein